MVCLFFSNRHDRKKDWDCRGDRHTTYPLTNFSSLLSTVLPISRTVCRVEMVLILMSRLREQKEVVGMVEKLIEVSD